MTKVVGVLKERECRIISILTSFEDAPQGKKRVAIRISALNDEELKALTTALEGQFDIVYSGRDDLSNLPDKKNK
mgnify:CR=1 FL=1